MIKRLPYLRNTPQNFQMKNGQNARHLYYLVLKEHL
nr:MAG TPA: hypothetical protein [Caudoviricetes sp.]